MEFVVENGVLTKVEGYNGETEIVVPEGVREIYDSLFFECCKNVKKVTLPESVIKIGKHAFLKCDELEEINLPDGLQEIGESAFSGCKKLTAVKIPDGVEKIENLAFCDCISLTEVKLPDVLLEIGNAAFRFCTSLTDIKLPNWLQTIAKLAFADCISITEIKLPSGLQTIGLAAFEGCESLRTVEFTDAVQEIRGGAFWDTGLQSVTVPKNVKYIGRDAFDPNIDYIEIQNPICDITECEFDSAVLWLPNRQYADIPAKCRRAAVRGFAMAYIKGYPEIEAVKADYLKYIKSQRKKFYLEFIENEDLFNLMIAEKLIDSDSVDELLENSSKAGDTVKSAALLEYKNRFSPKRKKKDEFNLDFDKPMTIGEIKKIWVCEKIKGGVKLINYNGDDKEIVIPEKIGDDPILEIGAYAFSPEKPRLVKEKRSLRQMITKVTLPAGLKRIENNAFYSCKELTDINIPASVKELGKNAFADCIKLAAIKIPLQTEFSHSFYGCTLLEDEDGFVVINGILDSVKNNKKIIIPKSVKEIARNVFFDCYKMTELHIHAGVTEIPSLGISAKFTIHAPAGSYAEQYAKKHKINFVAE